MNKIFKTVWNTVRQCLVVVNEATNSASQRSGCSIKKGSESVGKSGPCIFGFKHSKLALNVLAVLGVISFSNSVFADYTYFRGTINGDFTTGFATGHNSYNIFENLTVNGNLIFENYNNNNHSYVADSGKSARNSTLTVNGNLVWSPGVRDGQYSSWLSVANSYDTGSGTYQGTLNVTGDVEISNYGKIFVVHLDTRQATSNLIGAANIGGTLYINDTTEFAVVLYSTSSRTGQANVNIGQVVLNGGLFYSDESGAPTQTSNVTIGSVTQNAGTYAYVTSHKAGSTVSHLIQDTYNLNGGTLNVNGLIVGNGSMTSDKMTVGKTLNLAGGALNSYGTIQQVGGTINASGNYALNNFSKSAGLLNNAGTLTLNAPSITGGSFTNTGAVNITGNANVAGTIDGGGSVNLQSGTMTVNNVNGASSFNVQANTNATVNSTNTGVINNGGTLKIGTLAKNSGVTYTQTAGQLTVNNNWFTDSILNIQGGTFSRDSIGTNNVLNVSGGSATLGTIGTDDAINVSGGELKTGITQVFEDLEGSTPDEVNYIALASTEPQEIQTSLTEWFQKYMAGKVKEDITDNVTFTGGKVVVTGVNLTTTQRDDLVKAFKETFGIIKTLKNTLTNHLVIFC